MKDWVKFERLVAALHILEARGASVAWNDMIGRRQFDVTVRFEHTGYTYLTVIECKDWSRPVPIKEIEALAMKAKNAGADKAVMFSTSGYSASAIELARRERIELMSLEVTDEEIADQISQEVTPVINIFGFSFTTIDGAEVPGVKEIERDLPKVRIYLEDGTSSISLDDLVRQYQDRFRANKPYVPTSFAITLQGPCFAHFPHLQEPVKICTISFSGPLLSG